MAERGLTSSRPPWVGQQLLQQQILLRSYCSSRYCSSYCSSNCSSSYYCRGYGSISYCSSCSGICCCSAAAAAGMRSCIN